VLHKGIGQKAVSQGMKCSIIEWGERHGWLSPKGDAMIIVDTSGFLAALAVWERKQPPSPSTNRAPPHRQTIHPHDAAQQACSPSAGRTAMTAVGRTGPCMAPSSDFRSHRCYRGRGGGGGSRGPAAARGWCSSRCVEANCPHAPSRHRQPFAARF
jgi:hypothetical protein